MGHRLPIKLGLSVQETTSTCKAHWGAQYLSTQRVAKIPYLSLLVLFQSYKGHSKEGFSPEPASHSHPLRELGPCSGIQTAVGSRASSHCLQHVGRPVPWSLAEPWDPAFLLISQLQTSWEPVFRSPRELSNHILRHLGALAQSGLVTTHFDFRSHPPGSLASGLHTPKGPHAQEPNCQFPG